MLFSGCCLVRPAAAGQHAELPGPGIPGLVTVPDQAGPQAARGPELGDLFEEVAVDVQIEGNAPDEVVDGQPPLQHVVDVGGGDGEA